MPAYQKITYLLSPPLVQSASLALGNFADQYRYKRTKKFNSVSRKRKTIFQNGARFHFEWSFFVKTILFFGKRSHARWTVPFRKIVFTKNDNFFVKTIFFSGTQLTLSGGTEILIISWVGSIFFMYESAESTVPEIAYVYVRIFIPSAIR